MEIEKADGSLPSAFLFWLSNHAITVRKWRSVVNGCERRRMTFFCGDGMQHATSGFAWFYAFRPRGSQSWQVRAKSGDIMPSLAIQRAKKARVRIAPPLLRGLKHGATREDCQAATACTNRPASIERIETKGVSARDHGRGCEYESPRLY